MTSSQAGHVTFQPFEPGPVLDAAQLKQFLLLIFNNRTVVRIRNRGNKVSFVELGAAD